MSDNEDKKVLCIGESGNNFYYAIEPHDLNKLVNLPQGCEVEVNLGRTIDLVGGNRLELSTDLIVKITLISDKFLE